MSTTGPKIGSADVVEGLTETISRQVLFSAEALDVHLTIHSLWRTGERSDLTITCASEVFSVHRLVLCPRSTFFNAACKGEWKVD